MSIVCTIIYNGEFFMDNVNEDTITISNGNVTRSFSSDTSLTLHCGLKICKNNLVIGYTTLHCKDKLMVEDIDLYISMAAEASAVNKTYNGSSLTGVTGRYVTWTGTTSATNAGSYTAYATPDSAHTWDDGTRTARAISWTIAKATGSVTTIPTYLQCLQGTTESVCAAGTGTGTMYYSVDGSTYSSTIPKANNRTSSGKFTLYYYAAASTNYNQSSTGSIQCFVTPSDFSLVYRDGYYMKKSYYSDDSSSGAYKTYRPYYSTDATNWTQFSNCKIGKNTYNTGYTIFLKDKVVYINWNRRQVRGGNTYVYILETASGTSLPTTYVKSATVVIGDNSSVAESQTGKDVYDAGSSSLSLTWTTFELFIKCTSTAAGPHIEVKYSNGTYAIITYT